MRFYQHRAHVTLFALLQYFIGRNLRLTEPQYITLTDRFGSDPYKFMIPLQIGTVQLAFGYIVVQHERRRNILSAHAAI